MKAFISYAHHDRAMLERLHTHLAMLRREGALSAWYDREILPGGLIDRDIALQLGDSDLFLALVSPDFLNSQYCYQAELQAAIKRHETGEIVIVPIILEPCEWDASPLAAFKAVPRDGLPISEWPNPNAALLDVVKELRRLIGSAEVSSKDERRRNSPAVLREQTRTSGRYKAKKTFDDIDRNDFRDAAYETIRAHFEQSARDIDAHEGIRGRYKSLGPQAFTCTVVNELLKAGRGGVAHITVRSGGRSGLGDIYYSFAPNAPENTANGSLDVDADDYHLFIRASLFTGLETNRTWAPSEAAARLWQEFLKNAGIDYA
jgi:hypothetical protein